MNKKDCFALRRGICTALKIQKCEGCKFYKSKEQYDRERKLYDIKNIRG